MLKRAGSPNSMARVSCGLTVSATVRRVPGMMVWVEGEGWIQAGDLKEGDKLRGATGGIETVKEMHDEGWLSGQTVYNLHLTGPTHTYEVLAGNTPITVHNNGSCDVPPTPHMGKQEKHIRGSNNYESNKSYLTVDPRYIHDKVGSKVIRQANSQQVIRVRGKSIGVVVGKDGTKLGKTKFVKVHYSSSTDSVHYVPISKKSYWWNLRRK